MCGREIVERAENGEKTRRNKVQRPRSFSVGCVLEDIVSNLNTKKQKLDAESTGSQKKKVAGDTTDKESDAMLKLPQPGPSSHAGRPYTETDRLDAVVSLVTDQVELMQKSMQKAKISDSITHNLKKMVKDMVTTMMHSKMKQIKTDMDKRRLHSSSKNNLLSSKSKNADVLEERVIWKNDYDAWRPVIQGQPQPPQNSDNRQQSTIKNWSSWNLSEGNRENVQKKLRL